MVGGGGEFRRERAAAGEEEEDVLDACGAPGFDSFRSSVEDDDAKEMTRSGCVTVIHVVASVGGVPLRASTAERPSKVRERERVAAADGEGERARVGGGGSGLLYRRGKRWRWRGMATAACACTRPCSLRQRNKGY